MAAHGLSLKQINLLKKHRYILGKLAKSSSRNRKAILANAPSELFITLNLIFKLLNKQNLKLTRAQETKLRKHKQFISSASGLKSAGSIKAKVEQRGGAIGAILSTVLPVLGGVLKSLF